MSGVLAFLLFITGIPLAVYGNEWNDVADDNPDFTKETGEAARSLQAASVCFGHSSVFSSRVTLCVCVRVQA